MGQGGGDCNSVHENSKFCYTVASACVDGKASGQLSNTEWSYAACGSVTVTTSTATTTTLTTSTTTTATITTVTMTTSTATTSTTTTVTTTAPPSNNYCTPDLVLGPTPFLRLAVNGATDPAAKDGVDEGYCIQAQRSPANFQDGLHSLTAATCKHADAGSPTDRAWARQRFRLTHDGEFRVVIGDGTPDGDAAFFGTQDALKGKDWCVEAKAPDEFNALVGVTIGECDGSPRQWWCMIDGGKLKVNDGSNRCLSLSVVAGQYFDATGEAPHTSRDLTMEDCGNVWGDSVARASWRYHVSPTPRWGGPSIGYSSIPGATGQQGHGPDEPGYTCRSGVSITAEGLAAWHAAAKIPGDTKKEYSDVGVKLPNSTGNKECRCSGATDSAGAGGLDCESFRDGEQYCFTTPGACDDGRSGQQDGMPAPPNNSEWSFAACKRYTRDECAKACSDIDSCGAFTFSAGDSSGVLDAAGEWSAMIAEIWNPLYNPDLGTELCVEGLAYHSGELTSRATNSTNANHAMSTNACRKACVDDVECNFWDFVGQTPDTNGIGGAAARCSLRKTAGDGLVHVPHAHGTRTAGAKNCKLAPGVRPDGTAGVGYFYPQVYIKLEGYCALWTNADVTPSSGRRINMLGFAADVASHLNLCLKSNGVDSDHTSEEIPVLAQGGLCSKPLAAAQQTGVVDGEFGGFKRLPLTDSYNAAAQCLQFAAADPECKIKDAVAISSPSAVRNGGANNRCYCNTVAKDECQNFSHFSESKSLISVGRIVAEAAYVDRNAGSSGFTEPDSGSRDFFDTYCDRRTWTTTPDAESGTTKPQTTPRQEPGCTKNYRELTESGCLRNKDLCVTDATGPPSTCARRFGEAVKLCVDNADLRAVKDLEAAYTMVCRTSSTTTTTATTTTTQPYVPSTCNGVSEARWCGGSEFFMPTACESEWSKANQDAVKVSCPVMCGVCVDTTTAAAGTSGMLLSDTPDRDPEPTITPATLSTTPALTPTSTPTPSTPTASSSTAAPTTPVEDGAAMFSVAREWNWEGGSPGRFCVANGACVTGGNPANGQSQKCTIKVLEAGILSAVRFSTNGGDDVVTVNGVRYSGDKGPENVFVAAGDVVSFDGSKLYKDRPHGWKLCLHPGTKATAATLTAATATASSEGVGSGGTAGPGVGNIPPASKPDDGGARSSGKNTEAPAASGKDDDGDGIVMVAVVAVVAVVVLLIGGLGVAICVKGEFPIAEHCFATVVAQLQAVAGHAGLTVRCLSWLGRGHASRGVRTTKHAAQKRLT